MKNANTIETPNGTFKCGDRAWINKSSGFIAGTVDQIDTWHCKKGQPDEYFQPFMIVKLDQVFNPYNYKNGKWEIPLWRPEELKTVFPQPFLSSCCEAQIIAHDDKGHGKCSKCKENTTPIEPEISQPTQTEVL